MNNKGKVVIIDDSPIVRRMAEVALEEEGYEVYSAENGEEGIKITQEVVPSVILVDFIMPKMSGYQFCQAMKENQHLKDIPIILITGKGEDVGRKFLEKFEVADYFIKPFKSADLVDKVNSIIQMQNIILQDGETTSSVTPQEDPLTIELPESQEIEALQEIEAAEEIAQQEPFAIEFPESTKIEKLQTAQTNIIAEMEKIEMEKIEMGTPYPALIGNSVERIAKKFLQEELQFTIQKSISDVLKQAGLIKSADLILSGDLSVFPIRDILHLIFDRFLTSKLTIFSDVLSAEVYFENGNIIYASTGRRQTAASDSETGVSTEDIIRSVEQNVYDTISAVMELESGNFSIEKISLPDNLKDIQVRLNVPRSLIKASRKINDSVFAGMFDESTIFFKVLRDIALMDYNLNKSELRISACINGERTVNDIIDISGLDKMQSWRAFYVLLNGGIIKIYKRRS